jgi:hypothetical protein
MTIPERIKAIIDECSGVWGESGVTSWERDRLEEWKNRTSLSEKQEQVLQQIEKKVFGDGEDD